MSNTSLPEANISSIASKKAIPAGKKFKRWMIGPLVGVVLLVGVSVTYVQMSVQATPLALPTIPANLTVNQIGLDQWQTYQQPLPADPLHDPSLLASHRETVSLALFQDAAGQVLLHQGDLARGLAYLKAAVLADPNNLRYSNDYRVELRDHQLYQEEQDFFSALSRKEPTANSTIEFALTYVDMMRSCPKPPDGLVCQARYSYSSISVLDKVLQDNPYNVVARFARGLNHLYWPTLMGHLPKAQQDLQYSVALSKVQARIGPNFTPQAYVALGDVFAKSGDIKQARNVWLNGLNAVQQQQLLQQRLAIPQDQVQAQEGQQLRGLGVYVDTDISMFWRKG